MMKRLLTLLALAAFFVLAAGEDYDFYFLSDLHFGPEATIAANAKIRAKGNVHRSDRAMPAYENMFRHMAEHADAKTRFLIQCGDMVEGDAKGEAEHRAQLDLALGLLKKYFKFPVYHVLGNHDARGEGGPEAIRAVLLPDLAKTLGRDSLNDTSYTVAVGDDLFVFADYAETREGWPFLRKTLGLLEKRPRYLFVVIHVPVVHLVKPPIVDLLAKYDAIVLSGHVHTGYAVVYRKDGGTLAQVTVSSCLPADVAKLRGGISGSGPDACRAYMEKVAKGRYKPESLMKKYDAEWAPYLSGYTAFKGSGFLKIHVSDGGVRLEYQSANLQNPPASVDLLQK